MEPSVPETSSAKGVSIIIPAYNEVDALQSVLESLMEVFGKRGWNYEIIVVNDGSTDASADVLGQYKSMCQVVEHPRNRGYGAALKSGIRISKFDILVIIDADGSYPSDAIPTLLAQMNDKHMVVAARAGEDVNIPFVRKPAKWIIGKLANYVSSTEIPDLNSGLRVMDRSIVADYLHILPDGFSFTATITLAMLADGYQVSYVPINYAKRLGKSKIRPIRDTLNFIQLILRTVLYFEPLKVFLPLAVSFFGLSLLLLLYRAFYRGSFGVTIVLLCVTGVQLLAIGSLADLVVKRGNRKKPTLRGW